MSNLDNEVTLATTSGDEPDRLASYALTYQSNTVAVVVILDMKPFSTKRWDIAV